MARVRVRVVNFNENFQRTIPDLRNRLIQEARVDLQCEVDGCFLVTFGNRAKLQVMKALLEEFGFEFYYPTADYQPDWSRFEVIPGCGCAACCKAREFLAAQQKEGNGEQPKRKAKRK